MARKKSPPAEVEPIVEPSVAPAPKARFRKKQDSPAAEPPQAEKSPRRGRGPKRSEPVDVGTPAESEDRPKATFRSRSDARAEAGAATSTASEERSRGNRRGSGRGRTSRPDAESAQDSQAKSWEPFVTSVAEPDMPTADFRSPSKPLKPQKASQIEEAPSAGELDLAPRRSRRRGRGRDEEEAPITAADALETDSPRKSSRVKPAREPEPEPVIELIPPLPPVLHKPIIPTPEDAPQVAMLNGTPTFVRAGRVYPPICFFGSASDERRAETVLQEIRLASEAGIHLHSILVEFEIDPQSVSSSLGFAAYMVAKAVEADPDAQVLLRLVLVAPRGWDKKYPDAVFHDGAGRIMDPSVCSEPYWSEAKTCVADFVARLRMLESKDHVFGVQIERGEWFLPSDVGYDNSKAAVQAFRSWARTRYSNDVVALRAAWFDGNVTFDNLTIPDFKRNGEGGGKFMRVNRKERRWVDYHLFLSDATAHLISDLAYTVKEAGEGYLVVGTNYGYTFEWSHPFSGHLSLGKLLRTPEIDFIAGPPSYRNREPKGTAPFPSPIDSFPLNGKLYLSEEDYKTSIGETFEPDDFNPKIKTPQALESVHWRGIGAALAHASGVSWMDLWGNGWLKTPGIWQRGAKARDLLLRRMSTNLKDPDVAVFIDERALAYLVDENSFALLVQNVRESVLRSGLSAGFYLLSDLAHRESFPETRLNIFINAWDMRPEHRSAIRTRLQRDGKVLFWLYCGGLFDAGREALERAREVMGIAIKPQPFHSRTGTTILNRKHPLCEAFAGVGSIGGGKLEPSYFAIPEGSTVLGEYTHTGLPSFVYKEVRDETDPYLDWKSVFLGEPVVTPALIRALGQLAGAHVWNYQDDVVHARPPFLSVHTANAGSRTIMLPNNWSAYDVLADSWSAVDSSSLRFTALDGATHQFLVGARHEIEALLNCDVGGLETISELPPRSDNTVREDLSALDVPIVQLDEFIEGGVPEDASDEWLLRPKFVDSDDDSAEDEPEPETRVSRRRRRTRRGKGGQEPGPEKSEAFGDLGMHVLFRKRE